MINQDILGTLFSNNPLKNTMEHLQYPKTHWEWTHGVSENGTQSHVAISGNMFSLADGIVFPGLDPHVSRMWEP